MKKLSFLTLLITQILFASNCYESSIMKPSPFMGNNGEVFQLNDGSLWEVKNSYEYMYEYYPQVVICPNSSKLIIKGKNISVQSLSNNRNSSKSSADIVESRIDGNFEGWTGETIFKLQNGQIWQQSSYAYWYHYAFSPKVTIYKSGGQYKMQVDGVGQSIFVKRLK